MDQFEELKNRLAGSYHVHSINFTGHGGQPIPAESFSMKMFAEDVLEYLHSNKIKTINIFGYSMGGYVGMYLSKYSSGKIGKLITLATKFHWSETIAGQEIKMLDAEKIEIKLPAFAQALERRHHPQNWKQVLQKTANMLSDMGKDNTLKPGDYKSINIPVKLMIGDKDKMVTLNETMEVYNSLSYAQLSVLPDTPHPIEGVNMDRLTFEISDFLK